MEQNFNTQEQYQSPMNMPVQKAKKPIYKKWWFWLIIIIVVLVLITSVKNKIADNKEKAEEIAQTTATYMWPDSDLAYMLPEPQSKYGVINTDSTELLDITVYQTSSEQYTQYVSECKDYGFDVNYNNSGNSFSAEDSEGYSLVLLYFEDNKSMDVELSVPTEESTAQEQIDESEEQKTSKAESANAGEVTPSFKESMDSYEAFFDEYIEFMEKYNDSNDTVSMIKDYSDYMTKYADYMKKIDDIDEDELSTEDYLYFIELQSRTNEKLAKFSAETE